MRRITYALLLTSTLASAVSFQSLTVTKLGDKCGSFGVVVLLFHVSGSCAAPAQGRCGEGVQFDLKPTSFICGSQNPVPAYGPNDARAHISGWSAKQVNWDSAPDRFSSQVARLGGGFRNQVVVPGSLGNPAVAADFEFVLRARQPSLGTNAELTHVDMIVEVIAVDPSLSRAVSIEQFTTSNSTSGTTSVGSTTHTSDLSMPLAFSGMSFFLVSAEEGAAGTTPPSTNGVNSRQLEVEITSAPTTAGVAQVDTKCTIAGDDRAGIGQITRCEVEHVLVFADSSYLIRPSAQPELQFSGRAGTRYLEPISAAPNPYEGRTMCGLSKFGFVESLANGSEGFKLNQLRVMPVDCDNAFEGNTFVDWLLQGDRFMNGSAPNQDAKAYCPPPVGATYNCSLAKPSVDVDVWMDGAYFQ